MSTRSLDVDRIKYVIVGHSSTPENLRGAVQTVTRRPDGHTSAVTADVLGSAATRGYLPGGAGAAHITDTYGPAAGSLLVTKTIAGRLAGRQGPITINVSCNGPPSRQTW